MSATASTDGLLPPPIERRPATDTGGPGPLWTEWALTNGLGGFAMGSVLGTPTRRYHGLLVASARPPVERVMTLSAVHETVVLGTGDGEQRVFLTPFHFAGASERAVWDPRLVGFERGLNECRWEYRVGAGGGRSLTVRKAVYLFRDRQAAGVRYEVEGAACRVELRPLVAMRGFHALNDGRHLKSELTVADRDGGGVVVRGGGLELTLSARGGGLEVVRERWRGFEYAWELRRGMDAAEDLLAPAIAHAACDGETTTSVELFAAVDGGGRASGDEERGRGAARARRLVGAALGRAGIDPADSDAARPVARLALAGDEFVVRRGSGVSVIAGYPWFADWGRDSMIALPGLLLVTGRLGEALHVLRTFAGARRNGLIPNRFDDHDAPAHYNTVDAPLWFIHAARRYLDAGGDAGAFREELLPACVEIVEAYTAGTDYGIGVDPGDGLVFAGDETTQLTWMDAQRDGVTFTPRHGKACEINALWYNALRVLGDVLRRDEPARSARYGEMGDRARGSYRRAFTTEGGGLVDHLTPSGGGWAPRREIRPNQIFAISLPHSPLTQDQRRRVLGEVERELLTPHGLRTLAPGSVEPAYRGRFEGGMFERDGAYHNGTVWPWLLGAYAEAVLRAGGFSCESRAGARRVLRPIVDWLESGWCPGQLPEVFDGDDEPGRGRRADGCPAQAWSVAEALRVWVMAGGVLSPEF